MSSEHKYHLHELGEGFRFFSGDSMSSLSDPLINNINNIEFKVGAISNEEIKSILNIRTSTSEREKNLQDDKATNRSN